MRLVIADHCLSSFFVVGNLASIFFCTYGVPAVIIRSMSGWSHLEQHGGSLFVNISCNIGRDGKVEGYLVNVPLKSNIVRYC
jgi:hypothetical protein